MKKFILILMLVLATPGCKTVKGIFGKSATKEAKSAAKVELAQSAIEQNTSDKLDMISGLSFGTDYALSLSTNQEPSVIVAKELNKRVESIAGLPTLDQQKAVWVLVNDLISTNQALVKEGNAALLSKDKEIISLQLHTRDLEANKEKAVSDYMKLANATALKSDTLSSQLSSYESFWGLGGVAKGLFSFGKHIMWLLLGLGLVYTILRVLSDVYPQAGVAWKVFAQIGSVIISLTEKIFPQATENLGLVESAIHDEVVKELADLKHSIVTSAVAKP